MRNGKTLRQRVEALGLKNPDWDEKMHDLLDLMESMQREYERKIDRASVTIAENDNILDKMMEACVDIHWFDGVAYLKNLRGQK